MIAFRVYGTPVSQGSMRAVPTARGGVAVFHEHEATLEAWRAAIVVEAARFRRRAIKAGPVAVTATFYLARPKTVKREHPTVPPDVDKLARGLLDALQLAKLITSDAQVVDLTVRKRYSDHLAIRRPGVMVEIDHVI